jgi:hypothetical protein
MENSYPSTGRNNPEDWNDKVLGLIVPEDEGIATL